MSQYSQYHYTTDAFSPAHEYLLPLVIGMLKHSNAVNILDIGCGNGSLTVSLIENGFNVYGIDASEEGINIASKKFRHRFFVQDIAECRLPDELLNLDFDTIISIEVIEHLYDPKLFVRFCKEILTRKSRGGQLILSTPYHGYLKNLVIASLNKFDDHVAPLWDGGHIKFWSRRTLTTLLESAGFRIYQFKGAGRIPYLWKSMVMCAKV